MTKNQAMSLRSLWLGERLKSARTKAGYTLKEAGDYLKLDHSSLSRFERGIIPIRPSYVRDLVAFYGISRPRERDALLRLHEDAWRRDWWDGDTDDLDMEFIDYTWLEARASQIAVFEPLIVHGLLQTREYAEAVTIAGLGPSTPRETIDRMVELRTTRQQILDGPEPTAITMIVEEPALRRPIGGMTVLKGQLRHLLGLAGDHIDVRVLPMDAGWDPGHHGPFAIFRLAEPYPDVIYIESLAGRTFLEDADKVSRFAQTYDELKRLALDARKSRQHIQRTLKGLE